MTDDQAMLPGLSPPRPLSGDLEKAVRMTLAELRTRGHIDEKVDAARNELAIVLARIIEDKERRGRTSTVGNDARVLMELLEKTVPDGGASDVDQQLRDALDDLEAEYASATDASAEVRDTA